MKYFYYALCFALFLCACSREDTDSHLDSVSKSLDETYQAARESVKDLPNQAGRMSDSAGEEISKLHTLEYKVLELPLSTPSSEIERQLALLGSERWDCFSVRPMSEVLQVICKRHPKTFLRYIPKVF